MVMKESSKFLCTKIFNGPAVAGAAPDFFG